MADGGRSKTDMAAVSIFACLLAIPHYLVYNDERKRKLKPLTALHDVEPGLIIVSFFSSASRPISSTGLPSVGAPPGWGGRSCWGPSRCWPWRPSPIRWDENPFTIGSQDLSRVVRPFHQPGPGGGGDMAALRQPARLRRLGRNNFRVLAAACVLLGSAGRPGVSGTPFTPA